MSSKSHFFNRRLRLLADYQFNNNLIDDANGYNLTGIDITYNNDSAVFNGVTSEARRSDTNDIFSFTDGVNDLPFRIEISIKFNAFTKSFQFIVSKRDSNQTLREWQLFYENSINSFGFTLYTDTLNVNAIVVKNQITPQLNTTYNVVISYDGSKTLDGLNISVNGVEGTNKTEIGNYTGMIKTGSSLTLGIANWDSAFDFNGQIDYLKIYK